ncbi:hypothetical protein [Corynebacterium dentalis]|uniref:hypothetical protein n=1 Tax=Corynebacterium dentalis TaxID=2014528 RepID=UPI000C06D16A|nr:hypothetical protein [Corynebacterium dentalis]
MIIKRVSNLSNQIVFEVERTEYDAFPPVAEFILEDAPTARNPEREAVAQALMFGRWTGGEMHFAWKAGPNTINAIRRFLEPLPTYLSPIEYYPKALPIGKRSANLVEGWPSVLPGTIAVLPLDKFNGVIATHDSLAVSTNGFLFKISDQDIRPSLAVAVLFAEEFGIDSITLPYPVEQEEFRKLRDLLLSVRMGLNPFSENRQ